jgi:hypothetical protein
MQMVWRIHVGRANKDMIIRPYQLGHWTNVHEFNGLWKQTEELYIMLEWPDKGSSDQMVQL